MIRPYTITDLQAAVANALEIAKRCEQDDTTRTAKTVLTGVFNMLRKDV